MAKEYLEKLTAIIKQASVGRFKDVEIECRHFFSGAAVYVDGKICITLTPVGLALKLPSDQANTLLKEKSAKPFRYFPKGPIKKDYVVLSETIVDDASELQELIKSAIDYTLTLPKPVKKKK